MEENKIIELKYLSILEVLGEGAHELLQGQITCDLDKITSLKSCLGALCNVKGRVISSFVVSKLEEGFALIGPKKMLLKTEEELTKYSPFYKVKFSQNFSYSFYGIRRNHLLNLYEKDFSEEENTIRLGKNQFIRYLEKEFVLAICDIDDSPSLKDKVKVEDSLSNWFLDDIEHFNIEIMGEISEKYTPHELNYDVTKRIDFDKGCYTGQEVIARMHYRAKNLPRINLAESSYKDLEPNMVICNLKNKKVGNLVKVVNLPTKSLCLVSTKEKNLDTPLKVRETNSSLHFIKSAH